MLKDLRLPNKEQIENDYIIACNLVDVLYRHIYDSLQNDRSRVKVNMLTKSFIKSSLRNTVEGTKEYVKGMYPEDMMSLIDDMQKELNKRKR
jgi:hypothetical protein